KVLKDAVDGFHSILTREQRDKLDRIGAIRDVETVIIFTAQLDRENQLRKGRGIASRFISVLQSIQAFSTVVDTSVSANPRIAALVWGSIKFAMLLDQGRLSSASANAINHVFATKGNFTRVTFSFLQDNNSESLKAETTIRSIIRQSIDITTLPEHIELRLRELNQELFVNFRVWTDLTRQTIECSSTFYIFIDGLDESDAVERRALLDALSSLASTVPGLRIFIASRYSVHLDLSSRFSHMEHVSMTPETLTSAIGLYIEAAIQERIRNEDLIINDPSLLEDIKQRLTQHADGIDLEETFSRALSRITTLHKMTELAQKVFQWVAVAKQPLTLDELRDAISIEIGQRYSRPERLVHGMNRIVLWCENLVQVTEEARLVQFAHSTIRNFMVGATLPMQLMGFHVDLKEADHFAGEICVTYLHFTDFKTTIAQRPQPCRVDPMAMAGTVLSQKSTRAGLATRLSNATLAHIKAREGTDLSRALASYSRADADRSLVLQQSHPFLKYATVHWISHTARFQYRKSATWSLWYQIVTEGHGLARMPWQDSRYQPNDAILIWGHQAHHYALLLYSSSISILPESKKDELMVLSASQGDNEAIITFLEAGVCSANGMARAPRAASGGGHLQIVEQLLTAGADVNVTTGYNRQTALQAASRGGHLQIVERLLTAGADVNTTTGFYRLSELQEASKYEHLQAVEKLLTTGADGGQTAFHAASRGGHLQVVDRLLAAGAKGNVAAAAKYNGRAAFQAAPRDGHLQFVAQPLPAGADANAAAEYDGRTALEAASKGGHVQVVERLLAAGADVDAGAEYGGLTALQAASRSGCLQIASEGGHLQVAERLVAAGADVNAVAIKGRTALWAASEGGHIQIVQRLLTAGADVNIVVHDKRIALQVASEDGHIQVMERLLAEMKLE
ncbi:hypothetical protein S40285_02442, partial [Stachybotrys chlorohalonatus IBT 40285]